MHNLGNVFRFEVKRTLKKKSFWLTALAFPVLIGAVFGIIFFSNQATHQASQATQNQKFSLAITDNSSLVSQQIIRQLKATVSTDKQAMIAKVSSGQLDAYFYYPKDLSTKNIEIYAKDVGLFDNSRYDAVAKAILQHSVEQSINSQQAAVLQDRVEVSATTYKDGARFDGFRELIAPGIFLVLFFILISMFGNQMLVSTTEEKENRVTEMILTSIAARTLIVGKILSLIALAFIQILTILVPIIVIYLLFHNDLALPNLDLSHIPINSFRITIGAVIFSLSFLLFTGLLVAVGAVAPTAKEASGFFSIVMILIFCPLYAASLFVSVPDSPIVQFMSFFPLTAPIPLMLRNAVGNLTLAEAMIAIAILAVSAALALAIAVRLFRFGVLQYSSRISLGSLFGRHLKP